MWGNVKKRAKKRILRSNFIEQWKEKESNGERKKENEEKKRKKKKNRGRPRSLVSRFKKFSSTRQKFDFPDASRSTKHGIHFILSITKWNGRELVRARRNIPRRSIR